MDQASIDHLLTTTRSVRRRLDLRRAVDRQILQQCIDVAIQAPNGGNLGRYRFVVVTDTAKRARIGEVYRKAFAEFVPGGTYGPGLVASTAYLAEHLHEVPVHVIPCVEGRAEDRGVFWQATRYGSILPAAWSLMLALRSRGLGSAWTTLHLLYEKEVAALLGIPGDVTQTALLPVAYFTGDDFKAAQRVPGRECTYWDTWEQRASGV
jgi:nitroreductase